jgi:acetylornithine deacetylase/succinyl-diaminopimelate desuccinylase-like protein
MNRRDFIVTTAAATAAYAVPEAFAFEDADLADVYAQIPKQHDVNVQRLQRWIHQPSIAAENIGMQEGCQLMMDLAREAGFQQLKKVQASDVPYVFATLDAGAPKTLALYFMYDVKQVNPKEWSSPPFEARIVDRPGMGKVMVGRGAVNQKGPQAVFLSALHAFKAAGRKLPVNLVLLAEGEEEVGSMGMEGCLKMPDVAAAFKKSGGVFMPSSDQNADGEVVITLGAKGDVEVELTVDGAKWGRGSNKDIHSSNAARVDSPIWHLLHALTTLTNPDGTPNIDGFMAKVRPMTDADRRMIAEVASRSNEEVIKKQLGVSRWLKDADFKTALEMLMSQPTVNVEGIEGGYTGPGGKTVLPHSAFAKLDMRLVPDMKSDETVEALKAHLQKRGFGDIEVKVLGAGYGPNSTSADTPFIRAQQATYRKYGINPLLLPRSAGTWPGYVFTDPPLSLPAGHFGLCYGSGAHGPDEFFLIESTHPKLAGFDTGVRSQVDYLYEFARQT